MSNWANQQLTQRGRELQAKVEAGHCKLAMTKMKIGCGKAAAEDILDMTDLRDPRLVLNISSCVVNESDATVCTVTSVASSSDVDSSFLVTELGLYAEDPDAGEILYLVSLDSVPDTMPNKHVASPVTLTYQLDIVSSNAANITAVITPSGLATAKMLSEHHRKIPIDHPDGSVTTLKLADKSVTDVKIADGVIQRVHLSAPVAALIDDAGIAILQRKHAYLVGDIAYSARLPSWARLECVKAGTTGADEPATFAQMSSGGVLITDGGVLWIVDDLRDGTPVGAVRGSLYLSAGYVKANGATVQRADYPRLVALADRHGLWTDDTAANAGLFGRGDSVATLVLPNWTDRMVQLAGDGAGAAVAAGLPNITGSFWPLGDYAESVPNNVRQGTEGAFYAQGRTYGQGLVEDGATDNARAMFDASKSNPIYGASETVQPPAIKLIPIIRY